MVAPQVCAGVGKLKAPAEGVALVKLHLALVVQAVVVLNLLADKCVIVDGLGFVFHASPLA